ncbi:lysozyme family protein [Acidimangrovimonas sediminis]|uniref:hypothetical protein n=1 Tax=Acidimangrovimonas sediminis TaxID=2056283 RepID=UPI000C807A98|nr:hypothetical protein [Acidimangrovimonas sediminis]
MTRDEMEAPPDPRFAAAKAAAARRRRKARSTRLVLGLATAVLVCAGLGAGAWLTRDKWHFGAPRAAVTPTAGSDRLVAVRTGGQEVLSGFVSLPGDPLILHLGGTGGAAPTPSVRRTIPRPERLSPDRAAGNLELVQDVMISGQQELITTLPSSQEDFAVFQAQRKGLQGAGAGNAPDVSPGTAPDVPGRAAAPPPPDDSSGAEVTPADRRQSPTRDLVVRLTSDRPLIDILRENRLPDDEARDLAEAAQAQFDVRTLTAGEVLALRGVPLPDGGLSFRQISLYRADHGYIGSLARADPPSDPPSDPLSDQRPDPLPDTAPGTLGPIVAAADAWVQDDLFAHATRPREPQRQYRVLDAFYSAALRDGIPSSLVGQIIMLMSEAHDLDADAAPGDRMTVLYLPDPGTAPPGLDQVLYVAIKGANVTFDCFIYKPGPGQDYTCYGKSRDKGGSLGPVTGPVNGPGLGAASAAVTAGEEDAAVTRLVDRIIKVESGGAADARNPLSSATGAGQFINATWLRMMRTYRPDLVVDHTPDQLLEMRKDPAIARQMVILLAREGETYLRARGHRITAGRLYLAHFLGMQGASDVLGADPATPLVGVVGQAVIGANPFLEGHDCAYVIGWAERKMAGATNAAVFREPAGLQAFRAMVTSLLPQG